MNAQSSLGICSSDLCLLFFLYLDKFILFSPHFKFFLSTRHFDQTFWGYLLNVFFPLIFSWFVHDQKSLWATEDEKYAETFIFEMISDFFLLFFCFLMFKIFAKVTAKVIWQLLVQLCNFILFYLILNFFYLAETFKMHGILFFFLCEVVNLRRNNRELSLYASLI